MESCLGTFGDLYIGVLEDRWRDIEHFSFERAVFLFSSTTRAEDVEAEDWLRWYTLRIDATRVGYNNHDEIDPNLIEARQGIDGTPMPLMELLAPGNEVDLRTVQFRFDEGPASDSEDGRDQSEWLGVGDFYKGYDSAYYAR